MIYSKVILDNYLYILRNEIYDIESLKKELTVRSKYDPKKEILLYEEIATSNFFGIPLYPYYHQLSWKTEVIDTRTTGQKISFKFTSEFWGGQKELYDDFIENYRNGRTGFIIEAKPGTGKTVMAIAILAAINRKTLIVVPRSNLVEQWVSRLLEHSDLEEKDIGIVNGDYVDILNKKVIVGLVHSLARDKCGNDFKNSFGVVLFDEVHSSVPPQTFGPVVTMFNPKVRIGLSATLVRDDGLDVVFRKHIGEVYLKANIKKRMPAKVLIYNFNKSSGHIPKYLTEKLQRRGWLISAIAKNKIRNKLIVDTIIKIIESDRRILILSDRTWQLIALRKELRKRIGINSGYYCDQLSFISEKSKIIKRKKLPIKYLRHVVDDCKVIFATYKKFALGSDIKDLSGLVIATPQSSIEQSQGRIERFLDDKKQPVVIDIVDTCYKETLRWARSRKLWYKKSNVKFKEINNI